MGMQSAQVQSGTQPQGKGFAQQVNPPPQNEVTQIMGMRGRTKEMPIMQNDMAYPAVEPEMSQVMPYNQQQSNPPAQQQSQGKGGSTTYSRTSGQPAFGQPNRYPNTVGQWDNASIQRQSPTGGGKGKG
jgi:hypothetical protein